MVQIEPGFIAGNVEASENSIFKNSRKPFFDDDDVDDVKSDLTKNIPAFYIPLLSKIAPTYIYSTPSAHLFVRLTI